MFDKLKNQYRNIAQKVKEVPKDSQLFQKGIITPQEFLSAGDKLIQVSPIWQWNNSKTKQDVKGLPDNKCYLSASIYSRKRFNTKSESLMIESQDGFQIISKTKSHKKLLKKKLTLDTSSDEDDEQDNDKEPSEEQKLLRVYKVYITYDYYYNTSRFWITGINYQNNPLTKQDIYEDICEEYIDKTITEQENPYLGINMLSIHPCHHADVMKKLIIISQ